MFWKGKSVSHIWSFLPFRSEINQWQIKLLDHLKLKKNMNTFKLTIKFEK